MVRVQHGEPIRVFVELFKSLDITWFQDYKKLTNTKTETVSKETVFFWPKILKKGGFCGIMLHIIKGSKSIVGVEHDKSVLHQLF